MGSSRSRLKVAGAIGAALSCASGAAARTPLSIEQLLCRSSSVIVASIVDAQSRDCRLSNPSEFCSPRTVRLTLRISRVLTTQDALQVQQLVTADAAMVNGRTQTIAGKAFAMNQTGGPIGLPPTGEAVHTQEARRALIGRRFIFSMGKFQKDETFWTLVWPMGHLAVDKEILSERPCGKTWHSFDKFENRP